jgi:L-2-amino-thiazoline-4-carboxylic acid hydrolase
MTTLTGENYYVVHEVKLIEDLQQKLPFFRRALAARFAKDEVERIIQQLQDEFCALLPRLPYIGGKQNPLTTNLVACTWFLALYRVLQPRGLSDDEVGDVVYRVAEEWVTSTPRWIGRMQSLLIKTPLLRIIFGRISRQSQQRKYPGDFVVHFVPGDGRNFDFGVDFTGCAIHKFFQAEQAGHFAKYMCRIDYLTTSYKGIELMRTGTIANGADKCDFRYRLAGRSSKQPAALPATDRSV